MGGGFRYNRFMAAQPNPNPTTAVQNTDEVHQQVVSQIAEQSNQATGSNIPVAIFNPAIHHEPLDENAQVYLKQQKQEEEHEKKSDDVEDLMQGLRGRPRTAPAIDFLKDKMKWLAKKSGRKVTLK